MRVIIKLSFSFFKLRSLIYLKYYQNKKIIGRRLILSVNGFL